MQQDEDVFVHISPLGNNLNLLCGNSNVQDIMNNEGTTNAQTPTYECMDENGDYGLRRKSKNLDDYQEAPSRLKEDEEDIEMRMYPSEVITRSVSKMDITNLENKIKILEKQIHNI
jgi:hypothetical protein